MQFDHRTVYIAQCIHQKWLGENFITLLMHIHVLMSSLISSLDFLQILKLLKNDYKPPLYHSTVSMDFLLPCHQCNRNYAFEDTDSNNYYY